MKSSIRDREIVETKIAKVEKVYESIRFDMDFRSSLCSELKELVNLPPDAKNSKIIELIAKCEREDEIKAAALPSSAKEPIE